MKSLIMKGVYRLTGAWFNLCGLFWPQWTGKKLITVFSTPSRRPPIGKELAFLQQARLDRVSLQQHQALLYCWGNKAGSYVLLSYGWSYNAGRWRHYVPALVAAGYRVVA
jgi:hypothetical protein